MDFPVPPHNIEEEPASAPGQQVDEELRKEVKDRREAYVKKTNKLRARLEKEKERLYALVAIHSVSTGHVREALEAQISPAARLLVSTILNFNEAMRENVGIENLTDMHFARYKMEMVESRLRAAEIAMIEMPRQINAGGAAGQGVSGEGEVAVTGTPQAGGNIDISDEIMDLITFDIDEMFVRGDNESQTLPPVGFFNV